MKRLSILLLVAAGALASVAPLHSQSPQPPAAVPALLSAPAAGAALVVAPAAAPVQGITINIVQLIKAPITQLQAMKAANQAAIEKQTKTLQALDELQKQAEELKLFGKRS